MMPQIKTRFVCVRFSVMITLFMSIFFLSVHIVKCNPKKIALETRDEDYLLDDESPSRTETPPNNASCNSLPQELLSEIQKYKPIVKKIGEFIMSGPYEGAALRNITDFVDHFGSRPVGAVALENAIDDALQIMIDNDMKNVHAEPVIAPKWVRGREKLSMVSPYSKNMPILGLLSTAETQSEGITAEVVVVGGFHELESKTGKIRKRVKGKILVFNYAFNDAVNAIKYRSRGAVEASKIGAAAVLIRSVTPFSLSTPHTGDIHYESEVAPIPAAEISVEDAEFLARLYGKGETIVLNLTLRNQHLGNVTTRNSIGDYVGSTLPDEYVLVSGHIDSVDVGQGALDDGSGVILSLMVSEVMRNLQLHPKRTLRTILFSGAESGETSYGAQQYVLKHFNEFQKYTMFFEADSGIFDVKGLLFSGCLEATCIVSQILKLLEPAIIDKTRVSAFPEMKSDISELLKASGIPGATLDTDMNKYYWYQHSNADTASALNSKDLDTSLALMTSLAFVLADLNILLPRTTLSVGKISSPQENDKDNDKEIPQSQPPLKFELSQKKIVPGL